MNLDWLLVLVLLLLLLSLLSFVSIYSRHGRKHLKNNLNRDYRSPADNIYDEEITESEEGRLWPANNKR
ncbi:MAG TPA: hypothetical protein VF476_17205 [Chitinophagaceae bacterium]